MVVAVAGECTYVSGIYHHLRMMLCAVQTADCVHAIICCWAGAGKGYSESRQLSPRSCGVRGILLFAPDFAQDGASTLERRTMCHTA